MESQDNIEEKSFLQSVTTKTGIALKLPQFEMGGNQQITSETSRIVRICMLKYKCIFNLTLIMVCLLQFIYIAFKEFLINNEQREALYSLIDKFKNKDSVSVLNVNVTNNSP
jgi:hypothetical protein